MLVVLGFVMIAVFMTIVMTKRATPIVTLILVPLIFGLFAGAGLGIGDMIVEAVLNLAPTAGLLFFAIIYFGTMIDVGLFDPLIRLILRFVGHDPVKLVVGTALLTSVISLDGDGSTTFIIVTSALLPIYLKLGMSPVVLTVTAAMSNGVLNTVPWGGSTSRAAASLQLSPIDIFVPMIPAIVAGLLTVCVFAYFMGISERKRIGTLSLDDRRVLAEREPVAVGAAASGARAGGSSVAIRDDFSVPLDTQNMLAVRPKARPRLIWVNLVLTLATMTVLVADFTEPVVVFMVAAAVALVINFPEVREQSEQIKAHADSVISVVGMIFAATVLTGVMNGTGMVSAMAEWLVTVIPSDLGPVMAVIVGLLSIPFTFIMTNDAFYFGILPILAETATHFDISTIEMARASLVGQALHQSSPLVASFLLLIGLANVSLGEHFKKVIWRGTIVAVVMLIVGGLTLAYPLF
ncbi:CitMHS family transporter [Agrococcus terreus]|uniref:Citrate:proton symporter n=1 Tax=Agrococcus terreus TaxID=574649 RepID=A0ABQ2KN81_9MICO|nr:citrate:proton symporter [Agrococcus terreus]GGN84964.1 citrate:proton symporter [Agrococcus terreus]